ncbi:MAG TPA: hypothetical protein VFZ97_10065 [Acidimicrobiales bacterium]
MSGSETATGFGSRNFPPQMTMVAHSGTSDPREVVLDLTYSSDHQEREILGCRDSGVFFDFEGGQVRFGPVAQSNEGDYRPPLLQVPLPLAAGRSYSGTSAVIASDGSTERTEAWNVTVDGPVTLNIAGRNTPTWQITTERHSLPGSSQTDNRTETYWFDPSRHFWVKFSEKQHGQQTVAGFTITYDNQLVATLASFAPSHTS